MLVSKERPDLFKALTAVFRKLYPDRDIDTILKVAADNPYTEDVDVAWVCTSNDGKGGVGGDPHFDNSFVVKCTNVADLVKETKTLNQQPPLRTLTMRITTGETALFAAMQKVQAELFPGRAEPLAEVHHMDNSDVGWICRISGEPFGYVLERKTGADHNASIMDGRHANQIGRTLASGIDPRCVYKIVEGPVTGLSHGVNDKAAVGALVYPMFRYGFNTTHVASVEQTAIVLANLHAQQEHAPHEKLVAQGAVRESLKGEVSKKKMDRETEFARLLQQADGVSPEIAEYIMKIYPSFAHLIRAYKAAYARGGTDAMDRLLADVHVNQRRAALGQALSREIARFLAVREMVAGAAPFSVSDNDEYKPRRLGKRGLAEEGVNQQEETGAPPPPPKKRRKPKEEGTRRETWKAGPREPWVPKTSEPMKSDFLHLV